MYSKCWGIGQPCFRHKKVAADHYLNRYPAVSIFYACKEKLRDMYKQSARQGTEGILTNLIKFMKESDYLELYLWANTLIRCKPYILNYFDSHTASAVTERLRRKLKLIQRTAYGFRNPEAYARPHHVSLPTTCFT